MKPYKCAILYHNYYSLDGVEDVRDRIKKLDNQNILLLVSLSQKLSLNTNIYNSADEKFIIAANQGKDIGGKLLLIDLIIKLYQEIPYLIMLHDKRSYQKYSGKFEKEKLYEIISPEKFNLAIKKFESDSEIGIIGQRECIKNEFIISKNKFNTTNSGILRKLQIQYNIHTKDYRFVAGTMFWVRTSILVDFFKKHNPIEIRATLESGNVLDTDKGTITHSWERLFNWIVTSRGYKIEGI
jgi:hypothetical protein